MNEFTGKIPISIPNIQLISVAKAKVGKFAE
jgi:hypothetical protein